MLAFCCICGDHEGSNDYGTFVVHNADRDREYTFCRPRKFRIPLSTGAAAQRRSEYVYNFDAMRSDSVRYLSLF